MASVGDINVTVNVPPPSVVVAPAQPPEATEAPDSDSGPAGPLFVVKHWSQLAIGIDEKWRFWAITPAPAAGEIFKKTEAREIKLPGDRWKALLKLLGESPSGNCCDAADAIRDLGYLPPTTDLPQDGRANRKNLQSGYTADLREQMSASLGRLKDALSDLARELRGQVQGPKGRDQKAALRSDQQTVRSGFVVGFLAPDSKRHLIFWHASSPEK